MMLSSSVFVKGMDSISLYIFLLDDCIICQNYTPILNSLYDEFGQDVEFVGYFPNFSSKIDKIDRFREKYSIEFPLKTDYFKTQCSKYKATITPEVVLVNHSDNKVLYRGRIDNMFYKLGRRRQVVTKFELRDALRSVANQTKIEITETKAMGCYINYSDAISKFEID